MANIISEWLNPNGFAVLRDKFNAVVSVLSGGGENQVLTKSGSGNGEFAFRNILDMMPTGQPWTTYDVDMSLPPWSNKWVTEDGKTLGSSSSTADHKGTAYQNLFIYLWERFDNAQCPVSGGRGADAETDWAANKSIALIDSRGRFGVGFDSRTSDPSNDIWDADYSLMGKKGGLKGVELTGDQNGPHNHEIRVANADSPDEGLSVTSNDTSPESYSSATTLIKESGEGEAHENRPPYIVRNHIIKL